ncbi:MAG: outer membrane beta-barrel protein [Gammaproteobacteria bacterium]|nr:outer membrane beta-barrel protein [Gammaproteobacteria bacterium]
MKNPIVKLSVIAATLLLATTSGFAANYKGDYKGEAAPCPACQPVNVLKDGFYVGAQVGYDSYRVRENVGIASGVSALSANPVINSTGFVGGLLAGYGQYFNSMYYLGGELFVNTSGASQSNNATFTSGATVAQTNTKFTVGTSWGIGLLPGIKVNDSTLVYIRLGYNQARLKGRQNYTLAGVTAGTSKNNWQGGFNYGLGMETAIYPNLSLRTEYSHTNYNSFNNNLSGTKFNPADNQYMLGLIYHFA